MILEQVRDESSSEFVVYIPQSSCIQVQTHNYYHLCNFFGIGSFESFLIFSNFSPSTRFLFSKHPIMSIIDKLLDLDGETDYQESPLMRIKSKISTKETIDIMALSLLELETIIMETDILSHSGSQVDFLVSVLKRCFMLPKLPEKLIIDLIYRIPLQSFLETMISCIPSIDIFHLSDILEANLCDPQVQQSISVLKRIAELGIPLNPLKSILAQTISLRKYDIATDFCLCFRHFFDTTKIIRDECLKLLRQSKGIADILDICPDVKKEVVSSLPPRFKDSLSLLDKNIRDYIPSNWMAASDIPSLIKNNIKETRSIVSFLSSFPKINCDQIFISEIEAISLRLELSIPQKIRQMYLVVKDFFIVARTPEILIREAIKQYFQYINRINVYSDKHEYAALIQLNGIMISITKIKILANKVPNLHNFIEESLLYVRALYSFVSCWFYTHYKVSYSFLNFSQKETIDVLLRICYDYDFPNVAQIISSAWMLRTSQIREKYSTKCFRLGFFETGLSYAENRRRKTSMQSAIESTQAAHLMESIFSLETIYDTYFIASLSSLEPPMIIDSFLSEFLETEGQKLFINPDSPVHQKRVITKNSNTSSNSSLLGSTSANRSRVTFMPFLSQSDNHHNSLKEIHMPKIEALPDSIHGPQFYRRIKSIVKNNQSKVVNEIHLKMLRHYLKSHSNLSDQMIYFVVTSQFSRAFKYLRRINSVQQRWNVFLFSICQTAFSYQLFPLLKKKIIENDKSLQFFGSYLEKLLQFAIKQEMPSMQYEIETFLGRTDEATLTAIKLFTHSHSTKQSIKFLTMAQKSLQIEIQSRKNQTKSSPTVLSQEEVTRLAKDIALQQIFCRFCDDSGANCVSYLNLFEGISALSSMVVYLFVHGQIELAFEIIKHRKLSLVKISLQIIDVIVNEEPNTIIGFIDILSNSCSPVVFELMLTTMLMRLCFVIGNQNMAFWLISKCVKDHDFKCRLMIQFLKIDEAFNIAKSQKLNHLLPLIGHLAQKQNRVVIVDEINKLLRISK